jgi:UDP-N-acetylglucosamine diphosphorylase / glucose-1-phosphate thymidylyltransferase / UDP-N-acetylgalactosamine diphosphorylase / glucosamine-1-phosphate N-acetyltransferase / galactosamine-1-phosphate N-acetyltransferase
MSIILFDNIFRKGLYPFTYTKAVSALRFGILSMQERWALKTNQSVYVHTVPFLQSLYPLTGLDEHLWIDASVIPDETLFDRILSLQTGSCLADDIGLIAGKAAIVFDTFDPKIGISYFEQTHQVDSVKRLAHPWQIMQWNDEMIRSDFVLVTNGRSSQSVSASVNLIQREHIFIEEGAKLEYCTLNAATGPIYIAKNAEVMEGSAIRGPFALGQNSVLKLNSRIYGATTLGPNCMGGGEIKNSVMMGYSNKAHDGYLGDSVVGEWCNFGAGSTNSNIKNTAGSISVWDMDSEKYIKMGQKCGVIMGDYSRIAINAAINTGSVVGVSCNVFGPGLLPTIIPNFSWGVTGTKYVFEKAIIDINNWKILKGRSLTEAETSVLAHIFEQL